MEEEGQPAGGPWELELVKDRGAPGVCLSVPPGRNGGWRIVGRPLRCGPNVILCDGAEDEAVVY